MNKWSAGRYYRDGFTLIELLVVVTVIAILAGLVLPSLNRAKEAGRSAFCRNNMHQLTLGILAYSADDYYDCLPWPGGSLNRNKTPDWVFGGYRPVNPSNPGEWKLLDFALHAESGSVFTYVTHFPRVLPYDRMFTNCFPVYRCPSSGDLGKARRVTYSMNACFDPEYPPVSSRGVQVTAIENPTQKVLLVDESPETSDNASFEPASVGGKGKLAYHSGRVNITFIDGHCESLKDRKVQDIQSDRNNNLGTYFDPFYP